jgi:ubiquitin-protein ligase
MHPRLRRLEADYKQVVSLFTKHSRIQLLKTEGTPPEKYTFAYSIQGMAPTGADGVTLATEHKAEIFLPLDYPRRPPFCRMITPVFHPNIDPQKICIGDHWSAGQSLSQMVVHIGQMICYQSYNLKSPLNAKAAVWAEEKIATLPLLKEDLSVGL